MWLVGSLLNEVSVLRGSVLRFLGIVSTEGELDSRSWVSLTLVKQLGSWVSLPFSHWKMILE